MSYNRRVAWVACSITVVCLLLSIPLLMQIDHARDAQPLGDVLYIPSPATLKHLSLGYNGLMADIYWTRVVQYFGGKHHTQSQEYKLLAPLLEISTTLDPHLVVAYKFGSIFLAQKPPEGAGDPEAAARLVRRGIEQNPEEWRLWYYLGFIYWQEMHDSKAASQAFLNGSRVPGALPWMKVMAAALAQNAGEAETARYLWSNILQSTDDPNIRDNAIKRLTALQVDEEVGILQRVVDQWAQATGRTPQSFQDLLATGHLRSLPVDPLGHSYVLRNGRVEVSAPDALPFITRGLPPGRESKVLPKMHQ